MKPIEPRQHQAFFVPLKSLWLSFLNTATRSKFPESDQAMSKYFVSTSAFLDQFWPTVPNHLQRTISGERCWFGIRSIMNGGRLGHTIDRFEMEHFAQLNPNGGSIPKGDTKDFYNDSELKSVIEIQGMYLNWKRSNQKYDELDLVKAAYHSYSGVEKDDSDTIPEIHHSDKKKIERLINQSMKQDIMLSADVERFMRRNRENNVLFNAVKNYIIKVRERKKIKTDERPKQTFVGNTKSGINIYKAKISDAFRLFFSYISHPDFNSNKPFLLIRKICHTSDQNDVIKAICNTSTPGEKEAVFKSINGQAISNLERMDVSGPLKPVAGRRTLQGFEDLFDPNNICLDSKQVSAISDNIPLLIDGLAGTGKTAILAARAALRLSQIAMPSTILVTAAMPHVVARISDGVKKRTANDRATGVIELDLNYCGIESDIGHNWAVEDLVSFFPEAGFDEIVLDECQDLTFLEFEMLSRITKSKNPRRFAVAGDPMQTLNPTGFDWGKIVALFREKGVKKKYTNPSKFHMNYRSQSNIVHLANGIQRIRSQATSSGGVIMDSRRSPLDAKPYLVHLHGQQDIMELKKLIIDSGKGKNDAIVICWATDDAALSRMLEGEEELLSEIWSELRTPDYDRVDGFRTKFLIHSSSSIKGDEQNAVLLYKFASDKVARKHLVSLTMELDEIVPANAEQNISIDYAFSRLYVAITRAFDHVFIIEDDDGFEFWKNTKFVDEHGNSLNLFEDQNLLSSVVASRQDVFMVSDETTIANFNKNRRKWDEESNVDGLKIAVNIGEQLLRDIDDKEIEKIYWRLRGELSWRNNKLANTEGDRQHYLTKALEAFEKAGMPERIAPIRFEQREWAACRNLMRENSPFASMVRTYCSLMLDERPSESELMTLKKGNLPKKSPQGWVLSPQGILDQIKSQVLQDRFDFSEFGAKNEFIFDNKSWFGIDNILAFIVKKRFECKLLVELWNHRSRYHEQSADLFVRSFLKTLHQGLEAVDKVDECRRNYPKLDSKLVKSSIELRKGWLFEEVDSNNPVNSLNGRFFTESRSLKFESLVTMRNDKQLKDGIREKATLLYHANRLYDDYQISGKSAKEELKRYPRLLDVLVLVQEYSWLTERSLQMLEFLEDGKANSAFEFLMHAGAMLKSREAPKKSRFAWLNNEVYVQQLVKHLDDKFKKFSDEYQVGFSMINYFAGRLYYHIQSNEGRKGKAYTKAVTQMAIFDRRNRNYIRRLWTPFLDYVSSQDLQSQPLSNLEFDLIVNSIRHNHGVKQKKDHLKISTSVRKKIFSSTQQKRFDLELLRLKLGWPYSVLDGVKLKKKPKQTELEMYASGLKELEMDLEYTEVLASLPKDASSEMEKFLNIDNYIDFWKFLDETEKSFKEFDKMSEQFGLKKWIESINQLSWVNEDEPEVVLNSAVERGRRRTLFQHVLSLSEYPAVLSTSDESITNGLFFLQFTDAIDWFLANRDIVLTPDVPIKDQDTLMLHSIVSAILDRQDPDSPERKRSHAEMKRSGGKTLDERRKEEAKKREFRNLREEILNEYDHEKMYLNRIAAELFGKTLAELRDFTDNHNLDVQKSSTKKTMLRRVLSALSVEGTAVARHLLGDE